MKPIEEIYTGLKRLTYNGIEFIICPAGGENDTCTDDYINGHMSIDTLQGIEAFRVPAIKVGTLPNPDGYYQLDQLIFNFEDGNLKILRVEPLGDDKTGVFFNTNNRQIVCDGGSTFDALMKPQEFIVGKETGNVYLMSILWNYLVPSKVSKAGNALETNMGH